MIIKSAGTLNSYRRWLYINPQIDQNSYFLLTEYNFVGIMSACYKFVLSKGSVFMSNGYKNDFFTPEAEAWIRASPKSDKPRQAPEKPTIWPKAPLSPAPRQPKTNEPPAYEPIPLAPVTPPKIVPLPYDPDGKLHIELLPEIWENGLRNFMTEAGALYKSAENRYKDGYYDAYRGDAADYAARYAASQGQLGSTAASLLKDIETLRPSYGNAWADEAASTVNSALLKLAGYGDTVRNDPAYWSQYKDEADYGAAMFKAGAESGAELRQMVDMKNKTTGLQAASYKPAQPEALSTRSTATPSGAQKSASSSTQNYNNTFADPAILEAQKLAAKIAKNTAPQSQTPPAKSSNTAFADPALAEAQQIKAKIATAPYISLKGQPTQAATAESKSTKTSPTLPHNNTFADPALSEVQKKMVIQSPYFNFNGQLTSPSSSSSLAYTAFGVPANQAGLDRLDHEIQMLMEYSNKLKEREYNLPVTHVESTGTVINPERAKLKDEIVKVDAEIAKKKAAAVKLQKYLDTVAKQQAPKVDMNSIAMPFQQTASQQSVKELKEYIHDLREEQLILKATMGDNIEKMQKYDAVTSMILQKEKSLELQQTELFYKNNSEIRYQLETVMNDNDFKTVYASLDGTKISDTTGIKGILKYLTDETYRDNLNKDLAEESLTAIDPFLNENAKIQIAENRILNYITPDEQHVLEYYAAKGDWSNAKKYYETIKRDLQSRYQTEVTQWTEDFSNEHIGAGVLMNVAGTLASPAAFGATLWQNIRNTFSDNYEPLNTNTLAFAGAHLEQDSKEGITRDLYKTDKVLAEAGLALANYLVTAPMSTPVKLAISVSEAAGKAALEAAQNGATTSQVLQVSTAAGVIEYLTGKIPFDKLPDISKDGKDALLYYLEEMGKEAGIEDIKTIISYYGNTISNQLIMDNESILDKAIDEYELQGYNEDEATRKAFVKLYITIPLNELYDNASTSIGIYGIDKGYSKISGKS